MEKQLLKNIADFFSKLYSIDLKWKDETKSAGRNVEALKNQMEQLRLVTNPEVHNTELCRIEGLHERLVYKIDEAMEDETKQLRDVVERLNNYSQDLHNALKNIEAARNKVSLEDENMKELVEGIVYRPKLDLLLVYAYDACEYYQNLYRRVSDSLKALDYKDQRSAEGLAKSLREPVFERNQIDRILGFTQFIARETVR